MEKRLNEITEELAEIEKRSNEIEARSAENIDVDEMEKLNNEQKDLEEKSNKLISEKYEMEKRAKEAKDLEEGKKIPDSTKKLNERSNENMDVEIRNSNEYVNAFANYIKTGKDDEVRSLLSENGDGAIPVPTFVDETIRHAWETNELIKRVTQSELKGNVKVGFEVSAGSAVIHTEGGDAITEEALQMGIVNLIPQTIKKFVSFSDEALDFANGQSFLNYIYSELLNKIMKKACDVAIEKVLAAPETSTTSACGVKRVTTAGITDVVMALGQLSDEAVDPCIVMNRATEAYYVGLQAKNNWDFDPFRGLPIVYNNSLPAYDGTAESGNIMIVGDLKSIQVNFPDGTEPQIKLDDITQATSDLVRCIGRLPCAIEVVKPYGLAVVKK